NRQEGPEPLSAAKGRIAHRFDEPRRPRRLASPRFELKQRIKLALDRRSGCREPRGKHSVIKTDAHRHQAPKSAGLNTRLVEQNSQVTPIIPSSPIISLTSCGGKLRSMASTPSAEQRQTAMSGVGS